MIPLLSNECIREWLIKNDRYAWSHGGEENFLGAGILYYAITYMTRARKALCLGSGSGFVPKLMRQAQFDLGIAAESATILVDADLKIAGWGRPDYYRDNKPFPSEYGVLTVRKTTSAAAADFEPVSVDYLHIDAGHAYEDVQADFAAYFPKTKPGAMITLHDSRYKSAGVAQFLNELRRDAAWEVLDIGIGCGTALVKRRE